jgi:hypothetical protein
MGHGNKESELLARQNDQEVAWGEQCGFRDAWIMRDVTIRLVQAISSEKMTPSTHQGGEESRGGEGGGLEWNAGAVSMSERARGSNPSKNAIIFFPYKTRNLAITSAVNLSWWKVVM